MIKKFSIYFALIAALIVFGEGLYFQIAFQSLVLRTVLSFCGFYLLGNLLGVITIEAFLESQINKINKTKRPAKKKDESE